MKTAGSRCFDVVGLLLEVISPFNFHTCEVFCFEGFAHFFEVHLPTPFFEFFETFNWC